MRKNQKCLGNSAPAVPPPSPEVGQPTSFDGLLPNNFHEIAELFELPAGLLEKWDSTTGFDTKGGPDSDFNVRSIYMKAAAEIIEQYWKQILPNDNPRVFITSHKRAGAKGNHTTGAAMDIRIELNGTSYGDSSMTNRVPVLQTWASLKKLQAAGRLPKGGTGLYLNVKKTNPKKGIQGVRPSQAGSATGGSGIRGGPGGSASPHYDMRGFLYAGGSKKRDTIWVNLCTTGNGKDDVKNTDAARRWLRKNNLNDVANYTYKNSGTWNDDGSYSVGQLPAVGPTVKNLLQLLGLSSVTPVLTTTAAEGPFTAKFMAWKNMKFKHIIPGLGMIGNSPNPNGWSADAYNTNEKSPWRLRQDAAWTFGTVKDSLGPSMANSVIWWDWAGANKTSLNWPEKRWDIIRELGSAIETAIKLNEIKNSSISEAEKNKITDYQLGNYMKASDSPGEAKVKQQAAVTPAPEPPPAAVPDETNPEAVPTPAGITEEERNTKQNSIDNLVLNLKAKEAELVQLKTEVTNIENAGGDTQAALAAAKAKSDQIKLDLSAINTLRSQLGQEAVAGASGEPKDPCANLTLGKPTRLDSQLPGVAFLDYGLGLGKPLKTRSYVVIHESVTSNVKAALKALKANDPKLGVHFTVSPWGKVQQHVSMQLTTFHAGDSVNPNSIGVEVINPSKFGAPSNQYKPGAVGQMEAIWKLVKKIVKAGTPAIPIAFIAAASDEYLWKKSPLRPGIHAHGMQNNTSHSDGKFPVLYMSLRNKGIGPGDAYKKAWEIFSKKSGVAIPEAKEALEEDGYQIAQAVCPDGKEPVGTNEDGTLICPE